MKAFTFDDMKQIKRTNLGKNVPLELFRAIRLIGMNQGLPMEGKSTTQVVGRKIGESLPINSVNDLFQIYRDLKIGLPSIIEESEQEMRIKVDDCFCEGLPEQGKMVCDLEGAIMEGALSKLLNKRVSVNEVKCNINGDEHCEYKIKIFK